jgi:ABC-type dipeptide/oligopeptide/nickel transport system permease component
MAVPGSFGQPATAVFVLINIAIDVAIAFLDPRIRLR